MGSTPEAVILATDSLDVSVPKTTPGQYLIATTIVVLVVILLLWGLRRKGYWGLRDDMGPAKSAVRAALEDPPALLQLRAGRVGDYSRDELRAAVAPLFTPEATGRSSETETVGRQTSRGAFGRAWRAAWHAYRTQTRVLPTIALVPLRWAVLVSIFGLLAVSTQALITTLGAEVTPDSPWAALQAVPGKISAGVGTVIDVLGAVPGMNAVVDSVVAVSLVLWSALYSNWPVVAALLVLLAGVLWTLHRELPAHVDVPRLVERPRRAALLSVGILTLAWAAGAAWVLVGRAVGFPELAVVLGLATAVVIITPGLGYLGARSLIRLVGTLQQRTERVALGVVYGLLRAVSRGLSWVAFLLVIAYAGALLLEGRLVQLFGTLLTADPGIQATVILVLLAVSAGVAWLIRDAWPAMRQSLGGLLAQRTAGLWIGVTALPFIAVVPVYAAAYGILRSIPAALVIGILAGVFVRSVTGRVTRVADAIDLREMFRPPAPIWVTTRAWVLDPPASPRQFYAEVNGHAVAHTDREAAIDAVVDAVQAKAAPDPIQPGQPRQQTPEPTVAHWHAEFLRDYGVVDVEETRRKLEERVRQHTLVLLRRRDDRCSRRELEWQVESLPEDLCRRRWDEMAPFVTVTEDEAYLRDDIWSDQVQARYDDLGGVRAD